MPGSTAGKYACPVLLGVICAGIVAPGSSLAQQIYRQGFETEQTSWRAGEADVAYVEVAHQMVEQGRPASGPRAEYLKLLAKQGSHIYYQLPTPRAPLSEELTISLWVKANRPGIQLLARLVLPQQRDPHSYDDRLVLLLRGDTYRLTGRWQQLRLLDVPALAQKQQQLLQHQLRTPINLEGAYVDLLLLNVYGGPGETEVWIDDLEMGPVLEEAPPAASQPPASPRAAPSPSAARDNPSPAVVEFNNSHLLVNGKRFFFRGIRLTETRPEYLPRVLLGLRSAGFNTLWLEARTAPAVVHQAAELGFRLVPALSAREAAYLVSSTEPPAALARFPELGDVLFWDLGDSLHADRQELNSVCRLAQLVRRQDAGRPLAVDVSTGLAAYARNVNLVGVHRWPLLSTLELPAYRTWLEQRHHLAALGQPSPFLWTWIQTHAPAEYLRLLYDPLPADGLPEPIGPQPEQIRLLTYHALAAGCRGLAFSSDRFLANSFHGRDRLLGVGLLNLELDLLEPLLLAAEGPSTWIDTSIPEVKGAVLRTPRGILVLLLWCGRGAQYVPGQAAVAGLKVVVPQVPPDLQAWEVTPVEVRGLRWKRVVRGTEVTLGEFGLTTALLFTADVLLLKRLQERGHELRPIAAQWAYDLAVEELQKVLLVQRQLEQQGHTQPDAHSLLRAAHQRLTTAKQLWDNHQYAEAYHEAERALRPVRILMRAQWDSAVKEVEGIPAASPYALSFYTLPRHWALLEQIKQALPGPNLLNSGGFETPPDQEQTGWTAVPTLVLDPVVVRAERVGRTTDEKVDIIPKEGKQCLRLRIQPKDPAVVPAALEGTAIALSSPPLRLPPGSWVRIRAWVNVPAAIRASVDGALLFDNSGGETLALRWTAPTKGWQPVTLYRRVPAEGVLRLTLALTGLGSVYFDDLRVEPLPGVTTPQGNDSPSASSKSLQTTGR
jgi:hypothetical protein